MISQYFKGYMTGTCVTLVIILYALYAGSASAATITFDDGTQVEVPDDWAWSVKLQVKAPPKHCNQHPPAPPPHVCPPPPVCPPSPCDGNPYGEGCPLACSGPTPGDKCRRQREEFGD